MDRTNARIKGYLKKKILATGLLGFIGSNLWWLLLTFIADKVAHKINHESMNKINKWFAIIVTFLGVLILSGVVIKHLVY